MMMGSTHGVCKKGYYIVIISSIKEKEDIKEDFKVAYDLIGEIKYQFTLEQQLYKINPTAENIFVTNALDETSHFEQSAEDVLRVYKSMTGKDLNLEIPNDK